jgi:uncharacterized protein YjbJ (UPF0337 family)
MDNDRIKGSVKVAEGTAKETLGRMTDNPSLVAKGKARRAEGTLQRMYGKLKDVLLGR